MTHRLFIVPLLLPIGADSALEKALLLPLAPDLLPFSAVDSPISDLACQTDCCSTSDNLGKVHPPFVSTLVQVRNRSFPDQETPGF